MSPCFTGLVGLGLWSPEFPIVYVLTLGRHNKKVNEDMRKESITQWQVYKAWEQHWVEFEEGHQEKSWGGDSGWGQCISNLESLLPTFSRTQHGQKRKHKMPEWGWDFCIWICFCVLFWKIERSLSRKVEIEINMSRKSKRDRRWIAGAKDNGKCWLLVKPLLESPLQNGK